MQGAGLVQFAGRLWSKEHGKTVQAQRDVAEAEDLKHVLVKLESNNDCKTSFGIGRTDS